MTRFEQMRAWWDDVSPNSRFPTPKPEWKDAPYREVRFSGLRAYDRTSPRVGFRKIGGTWRAFSVDDPRPMFRDDEEPDWTSP